MRKWSLVALAVALLLGGFSTVLLPQPVAAQAEACDPSVSYMSLGNSYYNANEFDRSAAAFRCAVELDPESALPYHWLGNAYRRGGEHQLAIDNYNRAIEIDPSMAYAFNNRGWSYYNLGNYNQALADFEHALELDPDLVYALNNIGIVRNRIGQQDQAIESYTRAIERNLELLSWTYYNRGQVYYAQNNYDAAISDFNVVLRLNATY